MPRRRSLSTLSLLVLVACAHVATAPTSGTAIDRPDEVARSVIAEVEAARGLKAVSPIRVEMLDSKPFAEKLRGKEIGQLGADKDEQAVWIAFGFAGPGTDAGKTIQQVVDEQVVGFYAPADKALYVRSQVELGNTGGMDAKLLLRGILAHEVEHALQDQRFHAFSSDRQLDDDAGLARLALVEGDAMLAMVAVIGKERGVSMAQGLRNLATSVAAMSSEALARFSGHSESLLSAPVLLRETLIFPYLDGLALTGAAYVAGGFPLVDRMFAHLPSTTAQVLHPAVYAEGRQPVPLAVPTLPPTWQPLTQGILGELGTRAVLEVCLARPQAVATAGEWRGDRFAVGRRGDGTLGLVWQAVFATPEGANVFARGLLAQQPCWNRIRGEGPGSIADPLRVMPLGRTVVLTRGATPTEVAALVPAWTRPIAAAPPASPPLGPIVLSPLQGAPLSTQRGHLEANHYLDPGLGLTAEIPVGFSPNLGTPGVGLSIQRTTGSPGAGFFSYIAAAPTDEFRRQTFESFIGGMNSTLGGGRYLEEDHAETAVKLPLGQGFEKRWKVSDTQFLVRAAILPACNGRGLYLLGTVSSDPEGQALLGRWMESFQLDPRSSAPACEAPAQK